jgi:hypothetical protein
MRPFRRLLLITPSFKVQSGGCDNTVKMCSLTKLVCAPPPPRSIWLALDVRGQSLSHHGWLAKTSELVDHCQLGEDTKCRCVTWLESACQAFWRNRLLHFPASPAWRFLLWDCTASMALPTRPSRYEDGPNLIPTPPSPPLELYCLRLEHTTHSGFRSNGSTSIWVLRWRFHQCHQSHCRHQQSSKECRRCIRRLPESHHGVGASTGSSSAAAVSAIRLKSQQHTQILRRRASEPHAVNAH